MHRSIPLVLAAGLAVSASLAAPTAAVAAPFATDIPLGEPESVQAIRVFEGVPIPVGIGELAVVVGSGYDDVTCYMSTLDYFDDVGNGSDPLTPEFDVVQVNAEEVVAGGEYRLHCRTSTDWFSWWLVATLPPASTATLSAVESPYFTSIREFTGYTLPAQQLRLGASYRFVGEPGALPRAAAVSGGVTNDDTPAWPESDGATSEDGATASIVLPTARSMLDFGLDPAVDQGLGRWHAEGYAGEREGVALLRDVSWEAPVTILPDDSSTRLALSTPIATSVQRVKAIVRVTAPALGGRVVVKVDGRRVAEVSVATASDGRVVVTLPKLPRGTHRITAEYAGAPWVAPSVSTVATVRVLL